MYVSEIHASGFRCFGPESPLMLKMRPGLNILAGPNDAGKTAIIDAPRFVLWTRGDDFLRLEPGDFYVKPSGERVTELLIRCTFDGMTPDEQSRFLEWCSNEAGVLRLHVCLRATLRELAGGGNTVITQYRGGKNGDGLPLEGDLREYLKSTYLRPLRDAERELRSGRRSRLSRILGALPVMAEQARSAQPGAPATLTDTMRAADREVEANTGVQGVQSSVNRTYLDDLSFSADPLSATLGSAQRDHSTSFLNALNFILTRQILCPVWPRILTSLGDEARKRIDALALRAKPLTPEEGANAVQRRREQSGIAVTRLEAEAASRALGHDSLLIALHDPAEEPWPDTVIERFVASSVSSIPET